MTRRRSRPRIGDVFETRAGNGLAYFQYTHDHDLMGCLIRALPGVHPHRQGDLEPLIAGPHRFVVFYPLPAVIGDGDLLEHVGNFPIPEAARPFPLMKWAVPKFGAPPHWSLWDGRRFVRERLASLTPDQMELPEVTVFSHHYLIECIASDWSWATEYQIQMQDDEISPSDPPDAAGTVTHYLYFGDKATADEAAGRITAEGLGARVRRAPEAAAWSVTVSERDGGDDPTDFLEGVVRALQGEYDGSETRVG